MFVSSSIRKLRLPAVASAIVLLGACASQPKPKPVPPAPLVSTTPTLERFMSDALGARQVGARNLERETYRKAAQSYPTSKEPWLKLAESYFEAADYANAILAAQEVLQRDASDKVANSLLAVSGLRVSAAALSTMRQQQDLSADTRRQAEDVVKAVREALGETALVPKVAEQASAPVPVVRRYGLRRPAPADSASSASPAVAAVTPTPAPAPATPKKSTNPFDALK